MIILIYKNILEIVPTTTDSKALLSSVGSDDDDDGNGGDGFGDRDDKGDVALDNSLPPRSLY